MARTPGMQQFIRLLQLARRHPHNALDKTDTDRPASTNTGRRQFIKNTAMASLAGLVNAAGGIPAALASGKTNVSVAIIGAGLAGLNAAYQLKKAGVIAQVYEASQRAGGRVLSRTGLVAPGLVTELGAELINTDHADMLELVAEFGLQLFDRHADVAHLSVPASAYYFDGKSWSEAELAGLLHPLVMQINQDAGLLEQNWTRYAPKFDRYSVAQYLDQHSQLIPHAFIRTLFENAMRTEYGVEAADSSALQLLFLLPQINGDDVELLGYSDEVYTVTGGNSQVVTALSASLVGQVHFGMALSKIEKAERDQYELNFANGGRVYADYVILAVPFTALRRVNIDIALPEKLRQFIDKADLGLNEKVLGGYNQRVWRQQGFSLEAWTDLGFAEVWDAAQSHAEHTDGVLNYYLGGDQVTNASKQTGGSNAVGARFTHELTRYLPDLETVASGKYLGTRWTKNPWSHGAYANFKPGQLTEFGKYFWIESDVPGESQQVSVGKLLFAGEQVSDEYYGFMNGAAQTGRLAAGVILRALLA